MMYGWRARLGVIVSPPNTVCEREMAQLAPEGVSIHAARMFRPRGVGSLSRDVLLQTNESLPQVAESLGHLKPHLVLFAHTMGSMINGPDQEQALTDMLAEASDCTAITTATAVVDALKALQISRLSLAAPYPDVMTKMEVKYLEEAVPGLEVVKDMCLSMESGFDIGTLDPSVAYTTAKEVDDPRAEAIFLSGTNWRTIDMIGPLEADLGKPAITANQATFWAAMKHLHIGGFSGYGKLLDLL